MKYKNIIHKAAKRLGYKISTKLLLTISWCLAFEHSVSELILKLSFVLKIVICSGALFLCVLFLKISNQLAVK